jgi:hypothetical protein
MSNGSNGWKTFLIIAVIVLTVAVVALGFMVYNLNRNMARIDGKGAALTEWAVKSARWSTHVNADHLKADHASENLAPSHIPPPDDPPPRWQD